MPKHIFTAEDCAKDGAKIRAVWQQKKAAGLTKKGKPRTGRPQSDFFNGKAHQWTREDTLKSIEARRRRAEEKREAAERDEREAQAIAADPRLIAYTSDPLGHARRLVELQRLYEANESERLAKQAKESAKSTPTNSRRTLMRGESPLEALKRLNFPLYRDLLAKACYDEAKVIPLLEQSGRQLWS